MPTMSRRSRRRRKETGSTWFGKALIGLIVAGLVGSAVIFGMIRSYLYSDSFRRFLSAKASEVARVDGEFEPFRWDGLAVDSPVFKGSGPGVVKELRIEGLHTEVGLGGLRRGVWEIQSSRVQRLKVTVDARKSSVAGSPGLVDDPPKPAARDEQSWLPKKVEIQGLDVAELMVSAALEQGPVSVSGVRLHVEPAEGKHNYLIEATDGEIVPPTGMIPALRLEKAKVRWQDGEAFLSHATARIWNEGRLDAAGEWKAATGDYSIEGMLTGVKCEEVFNESWAKRFTGNVESSYGAENHGGKLVVKGSLAVHDGVLTALPVLDALAAYSDTRRFRILPLSTAKTDWRWTKEELFLSNLVLASEGLVRLEGDLHIRGDVLDGSFQLGLAPGTLARIPGAETRVFSPGSHGLLWTPLRITGTLDDPKEDLTDRLIAAAGLRMFDVIPETGEKVIRFTKSVVENAPEKVIDQGGRIIEKGADIVEGVGGVLDGILGGGSRKEPEKKDDP